VVLINFSLSVRNAQSLVEQSSYKRKPRSLNLNVAGLDAGLPFSDNDNLSDKHYRGFSNFLFDYLIHHNHYDVLGE